MESRVTGWNEQVAARRRGLSGRLVSLSKRWTAFGSGKGQKLGTVNQTVGKSGNYNLSTGSYPVDSPEFIMHRLADHAFMLRDWKLSNSVFEMLRADFADDKAWSHQAMANEMTAMSLLLDDATGTRSKMQRPF